MPSCRLVVALHRKCSDAAHRPCVLRKRPHLVFPRGPDPQAPNAFSAKGAPTALTLQSLMVSETDQFARCRPHMHALSAQIDPLHSWFSQCWLRQTAYPRTVIHPAHAHRPITGNELTVPFPQPWQPDSPFDQVALCGVTPAIGL
jgi:hypothetical protein